MSEVTVGSVWRERDSRFVRFVKIVSILNTGKAEVISSHGAGPWGTRITRISIGNFGKRYTAVPQ